MAGKIWVKAREGEVIPKESNSKEHITHLKPVEIALTPYYSRLLAKKALEEAAAPVAQPEPATKPKKAGGK